jgi:ATP-binding cassette subfamily B multidrug efflux pump
VIQLLRTYLRAYRPWLIAVLVLQAVQAAASLLLPSLNADIIDNGVLSGDTSYIWSVGAVMLVVSAVQATFSIGAVYCASKAAMGFGRDVREGLFERVVAFSAREVNLLGSPSLITRITNDVQQVQMLVLMTCTMVVAAPMTVVFGVIMAMRQDLGLSLLLAVSLPLLMIILGIIVSLMVPQFRLMQERLDSINGVLREQIVGMRVVRAFVREPVETERFHAVNQDLTDTSLKAGRLMALMFPTMMFMMNGSSIAVIWFGGHRIDSGAMSLGSLVAFTTYLALIMSAVMMATMVAMMAPRSAVSAERIQEVLDTFSSVAPPVDPVSEVTERGTLELRDVGFRYPGAEHAVLQHISFTSLPGQTTAIIGSTGAQLDQPCRAAVRRHIGQGSV